MGSGSYFYPLKREFLNLSGGTVSGDTLFTGNLSAATIYSGSTNIADLLYAVVSGGTKVSNGINTFTSGTEINTSINITGASFNELYTSGNTFFQNANSNLFSAATLYSGSTDISLLFSTPQNVLLINSQLATKSNLSGATFTGGILTPSLSADTLSGDTLYSGSTDVSLLFATPQNIFLINSELNTKANISGVTFTGGIIAPNASANTFSANTIFSASTDVSTLFATPQNIALINSELNTKANISGVTFTGLVAGQIVSANTISGNTLFSASTDLANVFIQGTGTIGTLPLWSGNKLISDSLMSQSLSTVTVNGNVIILGNVDIMGTASTFNTQIVQSKDNNILLNYSGSHVSAIGGGITILSGQTNGSPSVWAIDSNGNWSANTQIIATNGLNVYSGQIQSGGTDLSSLFAQNGSGIQSIIAGTNINTGGTLAHPIISLVNTPILSGLIVTGNGLFNSFSAGTISGSTLYSGNTDVSTLFAVPQNIVLINSQLTTKSNLSGATFTGGIITPNLSAATLSGGTLYSGTTELSSVIQNMINGDETFIQGGLNIYTGGTNFRPTVNISAATLNNLNVSGNTILNALSAITLNTSVLTGTTLYSGSTDVSLLFATPQNISLINSKLNTKSNLSGATFTGGITTPNLSATTISGTTFYSGSTDLSVVMQNFLNTNSTFIQPGINTYTGGTNIRPTVNVSGLTLDNISVSGGSVFNTIGANIILSEQWLSGDTDISFLFASHQDITSLSSQLLTKASLSGAIFTANVIAPSISANTISGGTLYSGSTELSSVMQSLVSVNQLAIQNGLNTYTGGTNTKPTINFSAATLNNLSVSGNSLLNSVSAITLSASTIYSGSANIGTLFATPQNISLINSQLITKANLSGATFGGIVITPSLSSTTLSGGTLYSGTTELSVVMQNMINSDETFVQSGLNIYTGGTNFRPTVNISAATLSSLSVSGSSVINSLSASTIISGVTNLYDIFHQKSGYLLQKNGLVSGGSFSGSPQKTTIIFTTPFLTNYAVTITGTINRTWTIEGKNLSGFTINANANPAFNNSDEIYWTAGQIGEGFI